MTDAALVWFEVNGVPAPQGSKTRWGSEDNPRTAPWRGAVAEKAAQARGDRPLMTGPVMLQVDFCFPRPKAHYRTGRHAGELKPGSPSSHSTKPDVDKLLRAIGDALSGVIWRDDCQVVSVTATKTYAEHACARIWITDLTVPVPDELAA
jgi:Holliday junction resolvase RusA-like endonuclease